MGRVFATEMVAAGLVPEHSTPMLAAGTLLEALFDNPGSHGLTPKEAAGIHSGMVFGSIAMGRSDRRSDIDINVNVLPDYAEEAALGAKRMAGTIETLHQVKVGMLLRRTDTLSARYARLTTVGDGCMCATDDFLFDHLHVIQTTYPLWARNNPIPQQRVELPITLEAAARNACDYLDAKGYTFENRLGKEDSSQPDIKALQYALELPRAVGRYILSVFEGVDGSRRVIADNQWGLAWLIEYASNDEAQCTKLKALTAKDWEYGELLESTLHAGNASSLAAYDKWLSGEYPLAVAYARDVAYFWRDIAAQQIKRCQV